MRESYFTRTSKIIFTEVGHLVRSCKRSHRRLTCITCSKYLCLMLGHRGMVIKFNMIRFGAFTLGVCLSPKMNNFQTVLTSRALFLSRNMHPQLMLWCQEHGIERKRLSDRIIQVHHILKTREILMQRWSKE